MLVLRVSCKIWICKILKCLFKERFWRRKRKNKLQLGTFHPQTLQVTFPIVHWVLFKHFMKLLLYKVERYCTVRLVCRSLNVVWLASEKITELKFWFYCDCWLNLLGPTSDHSTSWCLNKNSIYGLHSSSFFYKIQYNIFMLIFLGHQFGESIECKKNVSSLFL